MRVVPVVPHAMDGSEAAAAPASTEEVPGTSADSRQTGGSMSNCGEGVSSSVRKSLSKSGNMHVSKRKISRKFYSFGRNFGVDSLRRYVDSFLGDAASETELTRQQTIKLRIRELLDENSHKFSSTAVGIVILSVILLSSATFVFETTKSVKRDVRVMDIFNDLEYFYVVFFTLEIGIRFYAHVESFEDFVNFFRNLQNLIDIAAVVPSYLNYMIKGDDLDLRFLRLTRVFRVVKLTKLGPKVQVVFDALSEAQDVLIMLFMNLMIIVVIFSSITYYFEKDQPCDDVGGRGDCFHSIPETCWWAIVTVLTVGYGDMYPTSVAGKLTAAILMVLSLIVLALPITIIGTTFNKAWEESKKSSMKMDAANASQKTHAKFIHKELIKLKEEISTSVVKIREKNESAKIALDGLDDSIHDNNVGNQNVYFKIVVNSMPALRSVLRTQSNLETLDDMCDQVMEFRSLAKQLRRLMTETETILDRSQDLKMKLMRALSERIPSMNIGNTNVKVHEFDYVAIIHVLGASGLAARDLNGTSDPYVIVKHTDQEASTRVVQKSLSPMFDETLAVFIKNTKTPISVSVWDKDDVSADDELGMIDIDLSSFEVGKQYVMKKLLAGRKCTGSISLCIALRDINDSSLLQGVEPVYRSITKALLGIDLHGQKVVQMIPSVVGSAEVPTSALETNTE